MLSIAAVALGLYGFYHFGRDLPAYRHLATYQPPVVSRVHAADGRLLAEYAREKRIFVPIDAMPKLVIKAFLSAEDKRFYSHFGVDFFGLTRAVIANVKALGSGKRLVGASTITQQVAKNFLLTNEVSITRKAKEAILALRIERALSKDRILELYLNQIYLGNRSYGVAAAALNYFNKSLDDLTVAEVAYLAALPKGPRNYHPTRRRAAAIARRNWVIDRMQANGFISQNRADSARQTDLQTRSRTAGDRTTADFFAEEVRRELVNRFGENGLYGGGLSVHATLDPKLQRIADNALRNGLEFYDRRHGWRGPLASIDLTGDWQTSLAKMKKPAGTPMDWEIAMVTSVTKKTLVIAFADGRSGTIPLAELRWARAWKKHQRRGGKVKHPKQVATAGDIILAAAVTENQKAEPYPKNTYGLRQIPDVNGAIIALDPHTGRILAMSGGYSAKVSKFNRATQARRQPGSAFKPLVYLAALEQGYTPATRILDAPFVIDQGAGRGKWKPANYTKKFYGPTPMRTGIEKSRNLMTVRLAQTIGMSRIQEVAARFNVDKNLPPKLSMSLGAGETTLLRLVSAYAMLVNGGREIQPSLIDRIQDRAGRTVFRHDRRACATCIGQNWNGQIPPPLADERQQIADPAAAYQIVSMLRGVVQRGTGVRIAKVGKPLAGKTGTSNDNVDTWFIGFSPDLAVGVYVGFDMPRTLGPRDTGSNVAAPIFKTFMEKALADQPAIPFRRPPGVRLVRINAVSGALAGPNDKKVIIEAFKLGTEPEGESLILDGGVAANFGNRRHSNGEAVADGASGLY
jgi:penicillin-binding protein 1A